MRIMYIKYIPFRFKEILNILTMTKYLHFMVTVTCVARHPLPYQRRQGNRRNQPFTPAGRQHLQLVPGHIKAGEGEEDGELPLHMFNTCIQHVSLCFWTSTSRWGPAEEPTRNLSLPPHRTSGTSEWLFCTLIPTALHNKLCSRDFASTCVSVPCFARHSCYLAE